MSVDPKERYQSAEKMRRALEKISIELNWDEQVLNNGMRWISGHHGICYQVTMFVDKKKNWSVEVWKGQSKKLLRKINRLSKKNLSKSGAFSLAKDVLQSFVNGDEN